MEEITITALASLQAGTRILLHFSGAPIVTHNGTSLILQGSTNFQAAAGDVLEFVSLGSGNWREVNRHTAGTPGGSVTVNDKSGTDVTVTNTVTETTLISKSIPGGTLGSHGRLRVTLRIKISAVDPGTADVNTVTFRCKYGATTLVTTAAIKAANNDGTNPAVILSNDSWLLQFDLSGHGATGAQTGYSHFAGQATPTGAAGEQPHPYGDATADRPTAHGTSTEDSTIAKTLAVTAQWNRAQVGNTLVLEHWAIEVL